MWSHLWDSFSDHLHYNLRQFLNTIAHYKRGECGDWLRSHSKSVGVGCVAFKNSIILIPSFPSLGFLLVFSDNKDTNR